MISKPSLFGETDYDFILLSHAGWIKVEEISMYGNGLIQLVSDKKELLFHVDSIIAVKKNIK